ncbi:GntR family transcriptional regulator [Nesterenkonia sp. HG001]|uniref:GntR family transcriptional regulator n=1 Tax=Nesterenkonia sp. HG001 TaxID=2983207 RepID=UPI002AC7BF00|nr:GntR family transcriptional regulator [Nesterenkonia sp. HG001]MDZ5077640.1 GntR family transcriptional regulator [Nesterenkonia sp. HG001]
MPTTAARSPRSFTRVNRESTASLITRQLREGIMYGSLPAGTQLSEARLSAEFGVSRGPLREAMQRLVQEGLVRSEPNRGLFVKELDAEEIRDLYVARSAVESAAALMIIRERTPGAVEQLRSACEAMRRAAAAEDLSALSDADFDFHEALVTASGSPRLRRMHETLMVETRMCLTALQGTYFDPDDQAEEHRRIADAVAAGDEATVLSEIDDHMHQALERLIRHGQHVTEE